MPVRHSFESPITDGGDPDLVGPDEWNDDHVGEPLDLSARAVIRGECFLAATSMEGGIGQSLANGGLVANTAGESNHPGVVSVSTQTATNGRATLIAGSTDSVVLGEGEAYVGIIARITDLSDGTDTFTVRTGLSDSSSGDPTDGVFFRYTDAVNGGRWEAVCRSNSSETADDTGETADTSWHRFEITINAAGTSADFSIDGSVVSTITTNIPTGASRLTGVMPASIVKSAGTTSRSLKLDAYAYIFEFTTPR